MPEETDRQTSENLLNYKHISEINQEDREKAVKLAENVKNLWETYGICSSETAEVHLTEAKKMIEQIQALGFIVSLKHSLILDGNRSIRLETDVILQTVRFPTGHA
ncbi:MAG: hypothetical protein HYT65_00130 [Candidatus Yanofskybacteria bacterium]|nr:hypothetical protein [Candidatus Yanofskybacteria bacterium]